MLRMTSKRPGGPDGTPTEDRSHETENAPAQRADSNRLWNTSVGDDMAFLLARANALSLSRVQARLKQFDLNTRSYSVLAVAADDARPTQRELSEFLRLDPSQIVALVDQLEEAGLIKREPDPRDRRAKVVVPTEAGRSLAAEARLAVSESDREWFSALPPEDRDRWFSALRSLASDPAAD